MFAILEGIIPYIAFFGGILAWRLLESKVGNSQIVISDHEEQIYNDHGESRIAEIEAKVKVMELALTKENIINVSATAEGGRGGDAHAFGGDLKTGGGDAVIGNQTKA